MWRWYQKLKSDQKEFKEAKRYASYLAHTLRSKIKGLEENDPDFILCDDLPGILTQIDNMIAILSKDYKSQLNQ